MSKRVLDEFANREKILIDILEETTPPPPLKEAAPLSITRKSSLFPTAVANRNANPRFQPGNITTTAHHPPQVATSALMYTHQQQPSLIHVTGRQILVHQPTPAGATAQPQSQQLLSFIHGGDQYNNATALSSADSLLLRQAAGQQPTGHHSVQPTHSFQQQVVLQHQGLTFMNPGNRPINPGTGTAHSFFDSNQNQ